MSKVLLIYTGGTIGMVENPVTGAHEPLDFNHLACHVPELSQLKVDITTLQLDPPIDSSNMNPELWKHLVHIIADHYESFDGFVILHGTDTMAYTASALSYMLQNIAKPVILTGSQLPIGVLRTDGKENLITKRKKTKRSNFGNLVEQIRRLFGNKPLGTTSNSTAVSTPKTKGNKGIDSSSKGNEWVSGNYVRKGPKPKYGYARDRFGRVQERDSYREDRSVNPYHSNSNYDREDDNDSLDMLD